MKTSLKLFIYLFWLVNLPIIAQNKITTIEKDGLSITTFETENGTITIKLPKNIHAGDIISGTVVTEPRKKTDKKKSKKEQKKEKETLEKLKKTNLSICESSTQIAEGHFNFTVPKNVLSGVVTAKLIDDKMSPIVSSDIIVHNTPRALTSILMQLPKYLRSGYPQQIVGSFDGNFRTSSIKINNSDLEIIAESPEVIIFSIPEDIVGIQELEIAENDYQYTTDINIVDLNITADKMNLSSGESTKIHLKVLGMENLEQPVTIHIDNLTPENVSLSQGNNQELVIDSEMINEQGIYTVDYQIKAQQTGSFSISTQIQEAELQNAEQPIPAPDALNPSGPNSNEKPETEQEKEGDIESNEKVNSLTQDDTKKEICGAQESKWIENKSKRSIVESNITKKKQKSTSTCPVCKEKHVKWTYERVTYNLIKTFEKMKGICPKTKGHSGKHEGLKVYKTKNKISKTYKDRKVRHGSCGCTTIKSDDAGWIKLEKWKKQKCR